MSDELEEVKHELEEIKRTLSAWAERQNAVMREVFADALAGEIKLDSDRQKLSFDDLMRTKSMRQRQIDCLESLMFSISEDIESDFQNIEGLHGVAREEFRLNNTCLDLIKWGSSLNLVLQGLMRGENVLSIYSDYKNRNITLDAARSKLALIAVQAKLDADPKQKAKSFVKDCWQTWQEEPERYKYKSDFAKKMLDQVQCKGILTSQKKIEDWCREWEKAHPAG